MIWGVRVSVSGTSGFRALKVELLCTDASAEAAGT